MDKDRKPPPRRARTKPREERGPVPVPAPRPAPPPHARHEPRWSALLDHRLPLELAAINAGWPDTGLALVVVARRAGSHVLCVHILVDLLAGGAVECFVEVRDSEDFVDFVLELDQKVPLVTCSAVQAARVVRYGVALGDRNGVPQPEALAQWLRLLPPCRPGPDFDLRFFGPAGRPLAVSELLAPLRDRSLTPCLDEVPEPCYVVRAESMREH